MLNKLLTKLVLLVFMCSILDINAIGVFAEDATQTVADVSIQLPAMAKVNMKTNIGDTISGSYTYNGLSEETATEYRWLYSSTQSFERYGILHAGETTSETAVSDTAIVLEEKLAGKYVIFEVTPAGSSESVTSAPLQIATKNIAALDYALINSKNPDNAISSSAAYMSVRNQSDEKRISLLKFSLENVDEVISAKLVYTSVDNYGDKTMCVFPSGNNWDKSDTWNTFDWTQLEGTTTGDISNLISSNEIARVTGVPSRTNGNEVDLTEYINSELRKNSHLISIACFTAEGQAGITLRHPGRSTDCPYLVVYTDVPNVSASDVKMTDAVGTEKSEIFLGEKISGDYSFISEDSERGTEYKWLYAATEDADSWFTYKFGTTTKASAKEDTQIQIDEKLNGNYLKLQITPKTVNGDAGEAKFSAPIVVKTGRLEPKAAALLSENSPDNSVGMSSSYLQVKSADAGDRRAALFRYSLKELSYPIQSAEFVYFMYYSSAAGEHIIYDIPGGWDDGVTMNTYGSIETIRDGSMIGSVQHKSTGNQNIDPPQQLSVDFTDYVNEALRNGKTEINFAIWYAGDTDTKVSYLRSPSHASYPAQVVIVEKDMPLARNLSFSKNEAIINTIETGSIDVSAEVIIDDSSNPITMVAVLFDENNNMLDIKADRDTNDFYASLVNDGSGDYIEVYFWNNLTEMKELTYIGTLTSEGIFEK